MPASALTNEKKEETHTLDGWGFRQRRAASTHTTQPASFHSHAVPPPLHTPLSPHADAEIHARQRSVAFPPHVRRHPSHTCRVCCRMEGMRGERASGKRWVTATTRCCVPPLLRTPAPPFLPVATQTPCRSAVCRPTGMLFATRAIAATFCFSLSVFPHHSSWRTWHGSPASSASTHTDATGGSNIDTNRPAGASSRPWQAAAQGQGPQQGDGMRGACTSYTRNRTHEGNSEEESSGGARQADEQPSRHDGRGAHPVGTRARTIQRLPSPAEGNTGCRQARFDPFFLSSAIPR